MTNPRFFRECHTIVHDMVHGFQWVAKYKLKAFPPLPGGFGGTQNCPWQVLGGAGLQWNLLKGNPAGILCGTGARGFCAGAARWCHLLCSSNPARIFWGWKTGGTQWETAPAAPPSNPSGSKEEKLPKELQNSVLLKINTTKRSAWETKIKKALAVCCSIFFWNIWFLRVKES